MSQGARTRFEELLLLEIDGDHTPETRREYESVLAAHADWREEARQEIALVAMMRATPRVNAPEGILAAARDEARTARVVEVAPRRRFGGVAMLLGGTAAAVVTVAVMTMNRPGDGQIASQDSPRAEIALAKSAEPATGAIAPSALEESAPPDMKRTREVASVGERKSSDGAGRARQEPIGELAMAKDKAFADDEASHDLGAAANSPRWNADRSEVAYAPREESDAPASPMGSMSNFVHDPSNGTVSDGGISTVTQDLNARQIARAEKPAPPAAADAVAPATTFFGEEEAVAGSTGIDTFSSASSARADSDSSVTMLAFGMAMTALPGIEESAAARRRASAAPQIASKAIKSTATRPEVQTFDEMVELVIKSEGRLLLFANDRESALIAAGAKKEDQAIASREVRDDSPAATATTPGPTPQPGFTGFVVFQAPSEEKAMALLQLLRATEGRGMRNVDAAAGEVVVTPDGARVLVPYRMRQGDTR